MLLELDISTGCIDDSRISVNGWRVSKTWEECEERRVHRVRVEWGDPAPAYVRLRSPRATLWSQFVCVDGLVVILGPLSSECCFPIFSTFFFKKSRKHFPYFGNLTDGEVSEKLNFQYKKTKSEKSGNKTNCVKQKMENMGRFRTKNFDTNGP